MSSVKSIAGNKIRGESDKLSRITAGATQKILNSGNAGELNV